MQRCVVHHAAQGGVLAEGEGAYMALNNVVICHNAANGFELRQGANAYLRDCIIFGNGRQVSVGTYCTLL